MGGVHLQLSCMLLLPFSNEVPETTIAETIRPVESLRSRVLLVEDNADVATVARDYLEQCGCSVIMANNAETAVAALNSRSDIDLVFSDIVMPGMSGLELGRLVRDHHPEIPVVLASGYSDKAASAIKEGFMLLEKPYSLEATQFDCRRAEITSSARLLRFALRRATVL